MAVRPEKGPIHGCSTDKHSVLALRRSFNTFVSLSVITFLKFYASSISLRLQAHNKTPFVWLWEDLQDVQSVSSTFRRKTDCQYIPSARAIVDFVSSPDARGCRGDIYIPSTTSSIWTADKIDHARYNIATTANSRKAEFTKGTRNAHASSINGFY